MAKTMKVKLDKMSPVQLPVAWVKWLRKRREKDGVAMWRNVTAALEAKFGEAPDSPVVKRGGGS